MPRWVFLCILKKNWRLKKMNKLKAYKCIEEEIIKNKNLKNVEKHLLFLDLNKIFRKLQDE